MKKFFKVIFTLLFVFAPTLICHASSAATVIFDPSGGDDWYDNAVRYGRGIELRYGEGRGNIYATCEYFYYPGHYGAEHFPIFESADGGKSFRLVSDIYEAEFNQKKFLKNSDGAYMAVPLGTDGATSYYGEYWGMTFQPTLYELPEDMGEFKKGGVFCVGTTHSDNHSAIVLYYSPDGLRTWSYISTVAEGGRLAMGEGSAVWEGFLIYEDGELYCFFSDERGMTRGGGQRLVYKKTSDGRIWSADVKVCDFEGENPSYRPGMPVVTKMSNGSFFLTYEGVNMADGYIPDFYKISGDIGVWDSGDQGTELPGIFRGGSPYCATLADGNIVVGSHGTDKVGVNVNNAETNEWYVFDTGVENAYSRSLFPLADGCLLITSGGHHSSPTCRKLTCGVERIAFDEEIKPVSVTGTAPWGESAPNLDNGAENVADGDVGTFFDGLADGNVVIDLGREYNISAIGYAARSGFGSRMEGGTFYGSGDAESWVTLFTVGKAPAEGVITYREIDGGGYRYIKYATDGKSPCSIAEIKLYSSDAARIKIDGRTVARGGVVTENRTPLIPLRVVAEAAGADIAWISSEKSAAIILNGKLAVLRTGTDGYVFDGEEKTASSVIMLLDGVTYIPIDVAETILGSRVELAP